MNWQDHIVVDPKILVGKPVVKGTRIAVELVLDLLAQGWTQEQILENYPGLTPEAIQACLAYAREAVHALVEMVRSYSFRGVYPLKIT